jgi:hypothetical protein
MRLCSSLQSVRGTSRSRIKDEAQATTDHINNITTTPHPNTRIIAWIAAISHGITSPPPTYSSATHSSSRPPAADLRAPSRIRHHLTRHFYTQRHPRATRIITIKAIIGTYSASRNSGVEWTRVF